MVEMVQEVRKGSRERKETLDLSDHPDPSDEWDPQAKKGLVDNKAYREHLAPGLADLSM